MMGGLIPEHLLGHRPKKLKSAYEIIMRIPDSLAAEVVSIITAICAQGYNLSDVKRVDAVIDEFIILMNDGEKITVPFMEAKS